MSREFDVVVFGATGFTGLLCAQYLDVNYKDSSLRWAIAGRSKDKLEKVRQGLSTDVEVVIADTSQIETLHTMAKRTKVVLTTVGPYLKYGRGVVEACAKNGTSYVDLTGEGPFVKWSEAEFDAIAKENKSSIVHCCGFDSIPSDLGALLVVNHIREKYGEDCASVKTIVWETKGGPSGGTIDTVLNTIENFYSIKYLKESSAVYGLNPPGTVPEPKVDTGDGDGIVKYDGNLRCWHFPFIMAGINSKVVRRSNGLANGRYGALFSYMEVQRASSFIRAIGAVFGMAIVGILLIFPPTRWLLKRFVLPKPGQGPDLEARETGYFINRVVGRSAGPESKKVVAVVDSGKCGDPGYKCTAQMLVESAVCLVNGDVEQPQRFGVVTPAFCMGKGLIKRLNDSGMKFEITQSEE